MATPTDSTFRVVPRQFQHLVIFISANGAFLPQYFILTTARTLRLYQAVFQRVADSLHLVDHLMSDWEVALQAAARAV